MISNSTSAKSVNFSVLQQVSSEIGEGQGSSLSPDKLSEVKATILAAGTDSLHLDKEKGLFLIDLIDKLAKMGHSDGDLGKLRLKLVTQMPHDNATVKNNPTAPGEVLQAGGGKAPERPHGLVAVDTNVVGSLLNEIGEGPIDPAPADLGVIPQPDQLETFADHVKMFGHFLTCGNLDNAMEFITLVRNVNEAIQPAIKDKMKVLPEQKQLDIGFDDLLVFRADVFREALSQLTPDQRKRILEAIVNAPCHDILDDLAVRSTALAQDGGDISLPHLDTACLLLKDLQQTICSLGNQIIELQRDSGEIDEEEFNRQFDKIGSSASEMTGRYTEVIDLWQAEFTAIAKQQVLAPVHDFLTSVLSVKTTPSEVFSAYSSKCFLFNKLAHAYGVETFTFNAAKHLAEKMADLSVPERQAILDHFSQPEFSALLAAVKGLNPELQNLLVTLEPHKIKKAQLPTFTKILEKIRSIDNPEFKKLTAPYTEKLAAVDLNDPASIETFYQQTHFCDFLSELDGIIDCDDSITTIVKRGVYTANVLQALLADPADRQALKDNLAALSIAGTPRQIAEWMQTIMDERQLLADEDKVALIADSMPTAGLRRRFLRAAARFGSTNPTVDSEQLAATKLFIKHNIDARIVKYGLGARFLRALKNFFVTIFGGNSLTLSEEQVNREMVSFVKHHHTKLIQLSNHDGVGADGIKSLFAELMRETNPQLSVKESNSYAQKMHKALVDEISSYRETRGRIYSADGDFASYGPSQTTADAVHELFANMVTGAPDFSDVLETLGQINSFAGGNDEAVRAALQSELALLDDAGRKLLATRLGESGNVAVFGAILSLGQNGAQLDGTGLDATQQHICQSRQNHLAAQHGHLAELLLTGILGNNDKLAIYRGEIGAAEKEEALLQMNLAALDEERRELGNICQMLTAPQINIGAIVETLTAAETQNPDHFLANFTDFFDSEIKKDVMPGFSAKALTSHYFLEINQQIAKFTKKNKAILTEGSVEKRALQTLQTSLIKVQYTVISRDIKAVPANIDELAYKTIEDIIAGKTSFTDFNQMCINFSAASYEILINKARAQGTFSLGLEDYTNLITDALQHAVEGLPADKKTAFMAKMNTKTAKQNVHTFSWLTYGADEIVADGVFDSKISKFVLKEGIGQNLRQKNIVANALLSLVEESIPGYSEAVEAMDAPSAQEIGLLFDTALAEFKTEMLGYAATVMRNLTSGADCSDELVGTIIDMINKVNAPDSSQEIYDHAISMYMLKGLQDGTIPGFAQRPKFESGWAHDFLANLTQREQEAGEKLARGNREIEEKKQIKTANTEFYRVMPKETAEEKQAAARYYKENVSRIGDEIDNAEIDVNHLIKEQRAIKILRKLCDIIRP